MTVTISVPDQLARQAEAAGLPVKSYIERLLAQEAQRREAPQWTRFGPGPLTPEEAGRELREIRKGVNLGGLKLKDLVHECHKY